MRKVKLNGEQLKDYLGHLGWSLHVRPNEYIEIWRGTHQNVEQELLLPTESAVDGERLLSLAATKLAEILNRPESTLIREAREYSDNAIAIRVVHEDVEEGTIPLEDGITLNKNAKELIIAAANAALERRPIFQGRPPAPVSTLVQSARLGQTAHGSYVVRVFCPEVELGDGSTSFALATTRTLVSALSGLRESVDMYRDSRNHRVFDEAMQRGVSANLCDAIAKMAGSNRERTVEVSLRARSSGDLIPPEEHTFSFLPEHQDVIREISEYFRQTYVLSNQIVVGAVERLDRRAEREDGSIKIAATLSNGVQRSVSVQLSPDEYRQAIHAHEAKMMVRVTGDVVVTPRTANLIDGRDFGVVGNMDLFDN